MQKLITRKPSRLKDYDYSLNGYYFVTICSKNRENIFGQYLNNFVGTGLAPVRYDYKIKLSKIGEIINNQWKGIPDLYTHVKLDQHGIMPNHTPGFMF
ncbi:MAG: hypothetical protein ABIG64_07000 [Candidatus Omnitrophota bacterium]